MPSHSKEKNLKKLKIEEKASILAWAKEGISATEIAARLGRHKSSVTRLIARAETLEVDSIPARQQGSGRPRKVTPTILEILKRQITKYPAMTAMDLKESLPELSELSERTIQHALAKYLKMPSRIAAQKPLLTPKMKKKRLNFAKKYKDWTPQQWATVMFSDESTFRCIRAIRSKVRRSKNTSRFDSRVTVKTVKHPDSVMVWACFSGSVGRGGIYFLPKNCTMNGERYQTVLEDHLIPFMEIHGATHFLQDGAPCHASKRIKNFLDQQPFDVIDWPGNSPDLNPIENCWNYMKEALKTKDIASVPKITEEIKKLWLTGISSEYFKNLSDSMPRRLQMVIDAKGDMTKY